MPIIGIIGLGEKGYALAKALQKRKIKVLAFDLTDSNRLRAANDGIVTTSSISGVVMHLPERKYICLVLENGEETKMVVERLSNVLGPEDVVIDLGNTKFSERRQFHQVFKNIGAHFLRGKISEDGVVIGDGSKSIPHNGEAVRSVAFLA